MTQQSTSHQGMPQIEYCQLIRGRTEHEDEAINNRVIWLLIAEAFFLGAFVILVNTPTKF
jgi:hypothetical protein